MRSKNFKSIGQAVQTAMLADRVVLLGLPAGAVGISKFKDASTPSAIALRSVSNSTPSIHSIRLLTTWF
jgi:precorrin-6x reductase